MSILRPLAPFVLALAAATAAQGATGSGLVTFEFTGFSGPFGGTDEAFLGDPSQWQLVGQVNGQTPAVNGVTSPAFAGFVYVGGTQPLSGASVSMIYANVPGAVASVITFTPGSFVGVSTGQAFRLGTLSFTNGQWVGGSGDPATNYPVSLGFRLQTFSTTLAFNQTINDVLTVVTNQATGDCGATQTQMNEADFIYLAGAPQLGSLRVFDQACKPAGATNSGAVEVWGRFGSLDYVDFRNPTGSAFIVGGVDVGPIGGIPEPGAWALMLTGFGVGGAILRRRRRRALVPA